MEVIKLIKSYLKHHKLYYELSKDRDRLFKTAKTMDDRLDVKFNKLIKRSCNRKMSDEEVILMSLEINDYIKSKEI